MKKISTALVIVLSLHAALVKAQSVSNSGFEQLNADGSLSNWGNVYLWPMWIDSIGNSYVDSLIFDGPLYGPTNDAHGGYTALELRNAWDFTTNSGIAGAAADDDDSVFSSWGLLNLVPTNATPFSPFEPFNFGFYYKFFPVNGDSAFAQIALWDSSGNQLAEGKIIITDPASTYTLIHAPITYSMPGFAAFYSYSISNFYTSDPVSHTASFGTRLLVDDIGFNFVFPTGINSINNDQQFQIFPNPASSQLNISNKINNSFEYKIYNQVGQIVMKGRFQSFQSSLALDNFESGIYTIEMIAGEVVEKQNFIVHK